MPAEEMLDAGDVGTVPWIPLMRMKGPVEPILRECRARINLEARPDEWVNMLVVAQVLMRLRYNTPGLLEVFGGQQKMIESPLITEFVCKRRQRDLLRTLTARFGAVPQDVADHVRKIFDESLLDPLVDCAAVCPDIDAFRARLPTEIPPFTTVY